MKNVAVVLIAIAVFVFVMGGAVGLSYVGYSNDEIALRARLNAQQKATEAVFDNTWKIIQQQAQVSDQYKEAFRSIYPDLIAGRYKDGGGSLAKFVTEANPNFDTSLYGKLMTSIEAQRTVFTTEEKVLIDMKREHDTMRQQFPGSLFLSGRPEFVIKVVTSERTDKAFETGKDDSVDLFPKK